MTPSEDLSDIAKRPSDGAFVRRTLFVLVLVALTAMLWQLRPVVVLVYGALVLAVGLTIPTSLLARRFGLARQWALMIVIFALLGTATVGFWLAGDRLANQLNELWEQLPRALEQARVWLQGMPMGQRISSAMHEIEPNGDWIQGIGGVAGLTLGALGNAALLVVMAVYLAADPETYLRGAVRLAPPKHRARLCAALRETGDGLASWLMGQAISMTFVGASTALGLWLLDMPLALSLGFIAGLLSFVPYFGPIASGVLGVALAFTEGPMMALWVALLFLAIQQVEGVLLTPLVQRWATSLPPVLAVTAVIAFGILLGMPGVLFATPLMVAVMILVRRLYVEQMLEA
ncbi:MAG: AI-2E family transporter [Burkholderiaceae bacterium]